MESHRGLFYNMTKCDALIVGSGLTGSVIARHLHDAGWKVQIVEKRDHVGGNVHDHLHESGLRIHTYGPHYFRTNSEQIWDYVQRFSKFVPFEAVVKSEIDGQLEDWPITDEYIERLSGKMWMPAHLGTPTNFEEAVLKRMPRNVYEKFIRPYTQAQWGMSPSQLSVELAGRVPVRRSGDPRLSQHKYQGIPRDGYAQFMENMIEGIPFELNFDYLQRRDEITPTHLTVFTGPIDAFFSYTLGKLSYRSQKREHTYHPDTDQFQPFVQINNSQMKQGDHVRTIEWKHLPQSNSIKGTVTTTETPYTPMDPDAYEYPVQDEKNAALYEKYRELADADEKLLICGRLGEYRYYDMDWAIANAMEIAATIDVSTVQTEALPV